MSHNRAEKSGMNADVQEKVCLRCRGKERNVDYFTVLVGLLIGANGDASLTN